jgi:flavin-dependent dehydrogenase
MTSTDVLVVGAGPAGSVAAIAARRAGAHVMLVDRAEFPRTKACGCCLSELAIASLDRLGLGDELAGAARLTSLTLRCGSGEVSVRRERGAAIGRDDLDVRLVRRAREEGVDVRLGCTAAAVAEGGWTVGAAPLAAGCAVVCDGLAGRSLDARPAFGWRVRRRSRMGFGAAVPARALECAAGEIRMHVARGGYVGAVRLPDGTVDVAGAALPGCVRAAGGPAEYAIAALGPSVRDADALRAARWHGAPTLSRRRNALSAPGILLAGDAAGYEEPFTGEGMGWAIATGAAAGGLAASVAHGRADHERWPAMHAAIVRGARLRCRAISLALRSPALVALAIRAGATAPGIASRVAERIGRPGGAVA